LVLGGREPRPVVTGFLDGDHVAQVSMVLNFFPWSLMMRCNKQEHLSLETLSSQVLEFEGKAEAKPTGFLLG